MKKEIEIHCRIYLKYPNTNLAIEYVDDLRSDSSLPDYHDKWRLIDLDTGKVYHEDLVLHEVVGFASTLQSQRFDVNEACNYASDSGHTQSGPNAGIVNDCEGAKDIKNSKKEDFWHQRIGRQCWKAVGSKLIYQGKVSACRLNDGWPEVKVEWIFKNNFCVAGRPDQSSWERVANICFEELPILANYAKDKGEIQAYHLLNDYCLFKAKPKLSNAIKRLTSLNNKEGDDCQEVPS